METEPEKIHTGYADGQEIADTKSRTPHVDRSLIRITEKQTLEFFNEGLKQASDYAKRMGKSQGHEIWSDISIICDHIRQQGMALFRAKGLSWSETLKIIDNRLKMTSGVLESKRKQQKKFIIH